MSNNFIVLFVLFIGMTTPCSPTETTASSETTSSSSIDEMQMSYTIGVTEGTPYPCTFCDKAFPRLSYLKRHEQVRETPIEWHNRCDSCDQLFIHSDIAIPSASA